MNESTTNLNHFAEEKAKLDERQGSRPFVGFLKRADSYVREEPWTAVGIAAGIGLLLGLLMRRK